MQQQEMDVEHGTLLQLMLDFSRASFSAGWFDGIDEVVKRLIAGFPWDDEHYGFDTQCCQPPPPNELATMMYLIGKLGGFWNWNDSGYRWETLPGREGE